MRVEIPSGVPEGDVLDVGMIGADPVLVRTRAPVEVRGPYGIRRRVSRIVLTVDERAAFVRAARRRLAGQR